MQKFSNEDNNALRLVVVESSAEAEANNAIGLIKDSRIKLVCGENRGIYSAINRGITETETEYYIVIGLDDTFHFDKAGIIVEALELLHYQILFLGVTKGGRKLAYFNPQQIRHGPQGVFASHTGGSVIRKDLHENYGLYDTRFHTVADGLFLCRCLKEGSTAGLLGETFCTIGDEGFSKQKELVAEWESYHVRRMLGTGMMRSTGLYCLRTARRILKRAIQ